jgi:hypothetical protein
MSVNLKKSIGWAAVLIVLGVATIFAGQKWVTLFVAAAVLVWYGVDPATYRSRN